MMWVTSYASIYHKPGVPLFDLMATGKKGQEHNGPRLDRGFMDGFSAASLVRNMWIK